MINSLKDFKNYVLTIILLILILFSASGCNSNNAETNSSSLDSSIEISPSEPKTSNASSSAIISSSSEIIADNGSESSDINNIEVSSNILEDTSLEAWKRAYIEFLLNYVEKSKNSFTCYFSLHDFDGNDIPELIILIRNIPENSEAKIEVYSYNLNNNVCYMGEHQDPKTGTSAPLISNSVEFKGLFTVWWGGGVYHYGYISIENNLLKYEELWKIDNGVTPPVKEIFSNDTELVNESVILFPDHEYDDKTLLAYYDIDNEGFAEAFSSELY